MDLIRFKNVTKKYKNGVTAVNDISLSIQKGDFVFIIGSTGCGKSSLIKMLYREEKPTSGKILLGGIDVAKLKNWRVYKIRRKIGVVFQDFKLLQKLTVYENVAFALEIFGLPKSEIFKRVTKVLDLVGLKNKAKQYPTQLSGGEQQRVAIARAVTKNPLLLLCDEPTGALDYNTSKAVLTLLQNLNKEMKKTIVLITHNSAIAPMADKVITIRSGLVKDVKINNEKVSVAELEW